MWDMDTDGRSRKEESKHLKLSDWGDYYTSLTKRTRPMAMWGAWSAAVWGPTNHCWWQPNDGRWHGMVISSDITHSLKPSCEGGRRPGRQRKSWSDNIKEWTKMNNVELYVADIFLFYSLLISVVKFPYSKARGVKFDSLIFKHLLPLLWIQNEIILTS